MLLVLLSVVWGGSFFFNGIALREFPTLTIVTARVGLAALALLLLMRMLGQGIQLNRQILKAFFGMSFLNNVVPFSLIVWGQQHIASGVASILNATTPLFTMLVAHWFTTDEKINPRRLLVQGPIYDTSRTARLPGSAGRGKISGGGRQGRRSPVATQ